MKKLPGIKVFAPATIGNLAVGFDCLGMALDAPGDEIVARFCEEPGVHIRKITGDGGKLPRDAKTNTAGLAALRLLEYLGETKRGIEFELHKKMPLGSGLGSSAASAVAGVMAVNELLKRPLEKRELLPFALMGEAMASGGAHADNVAPALLGGIILVPGNGADIVRLPVPPGLFAAVVHPKVEVLTRNARGILKREVPLEKFTEQVAAMGGFVAGLFRSDLDLLSKTLKDVVIEPQRKHLIPCFDEVKAAALEKGALGCSISGSGPSVFALALNSLEAERIGKAMQAVFQAGGIESTLYLSSANQEGARKL